MLKLFSKPIQLYCFGNNRCILNNSRGAFVFENVVFSRENVVVTMTVLVKTLCLFASPSKH